MTLEGVKLSVFGGEEGIWFSCFGLKREEDKNDAEIVAQVEAATIDILGDIPEHEYLARQAIGGTMPLLNRVLKEMGVVYGDHKVPTKVLK